MGMTWSKMKASGTYPEIIRLVEDLMAYPIEKLNQAAMDLERETGGNIFRIADNGSFTTHEGSSGNIPPMRFNKEALHAGMEAEFGLFRTGKREPLIVELILLEEAAKRGAPVRFVDATPSEIMSFAGLYPFLNDLVVRLKAGSDPAPVHSKEDLERVANDLSEVEGWGCW